MLGDGNTSTLTYNFGGAAAGVDYRFDPRFLVGIGVGYTHGTEWVNGFPGQAWTDSVSVAAYGSFTSQGGFYVDALAGYAYYSNQLQRQMSIPGLQPRTATGSTGANQFLGQVETGYRLGIYAPASATPHAVRPAAGEQRDAKRLHRGGRPVAQPERGATDHQLAAHGSWARTSQEPSGSATRGSSTWRCGWAGCTSSPTPAGRSRRPSAGGPSAAFTVYAATPQRDSAVIGFAASAAVADATQIYLRYDGAVGGGTDNHMLNVGVRFSW